MAQHLEVVFRELGISQYLDAFVDQGFDSWETILDITESDLDALNVKLGHRRKLQRRIANSRGIAPDVALGSPISTRQSIEERLEGPRPEGAKHDVKESGITKRKYHRHPKRDVHAPERPPSAYVLFSNKMREDLKGRNLTFTEIAKLVGENWQSLTPNEKEPFESQAQQAKEKYNHDLVEYKKTPEYRQYNQYLHEFRLKHSSQFQDKETQKRPRLESNNNAHESTSGSTIGGSSSSGNNSGTASGESQQGSEPPPYQRRIPVPEPSSISSTPLSFHRNVDESLNSHGARGFHESMEMSPKPFSGEGHGHVSRRSASWKDNGQRPSEIGPHPQHLPSLSDFFDARSPMGSFAQNSPEEASFSGFMQTHHRSGPGPPSGGPTPLESRPQLPTLRKEQSPAGSNSSGSGSGPSAPSPYSSYPRTPSDASLPIHALLTSKDTGSQFELQPSPTLSEQKSPNNSNSNRSMFLHHPPSNRTIANMSYNMEFAGPSSGYQSPSPVTGYPPPGAVSRDARQLSETPPSREGGTNVKEEPNDMDGMSALLRAGEIVDQRNR